MDRPGIDDFDPSKRHRHVCDAEDFGEQESTKEEDSRKCGNEWRELLRSPSSTP